jgi:hypothetical protein
MAQHRIKFSRRRTFQNALLRRHLFNFALDAIFQFRFGNLQIVAQLQIQSGLRIRAEVACQSQRGIISR